MVHSATGAKTPVVVISSMWPISWSITKVGIAKTITAGSFTATIIVRNYVVLTIMRVPTGTNPGNG
jgi:aminopeptidase-like protein